MQCTDESSPAVKRRNHRKKVAPDPPVVSSMSPKRARSKNVAAEAWAAMPTDSDGGRESQGASLPSDGAAVDSVPVETQPIVDEITAIGESIVETERARKPRLAKSKPDQAATRKLPKSQAKRAKTKKAPTPRATNKVVDAPKAAEAAKRIQQALAKLDRHEGSAATCQIAAGVHLVALQEATKTKRNWTKHVQTIPFGTRPGRFLHPRTARRLLKLGASRWGRENGTPGSAILEQLPVDLQRLEWLCRLSESQLSELMGAMDCKTESRKAVINAVKRILEFNPKPRRTATPDKALQRFKKTAVIAVAALDPGNSAEAVSPGVRERLHHALDEALTEAKATSKPSHVEAHGIAPEVVTKRRVPA